MLLESLQLKIDLESFQAANVTVRLLVFLCFFAFLSQLWKLVDDCSRKNLEDYFLYEQQVKNFTEQLDVDDVVGIISINVAQKASVSL